MALRRIHKEYKDFNDAPPKGCFLYSNPLDNDPYHWDVWIRCEDKNSPHYNGVFKLKIDLPLDYPFRSLEARFDSKIYHPQLWQSNEKLCLRMTGHNWSPAFTISRVVMVISQMIHTPFSALLACRCCGGPADENEIKRRAYENKTGATAMYLNDRQRYNKIAKEWTQKYAMELPELDNQNDSNEHAQNQDNQAQSQDNEQQKDENKEEKAVDEEGDICVRLLREWNLSQYKTVLIDENGYDVVDDWKHITKDELVQDMKFKVGYSKRFLRNVDAYFKKDNAESKPDDEDEDTVKKLIALSDMGFEDRMLNSLLLSQTNGDVQKAVKLLLEMNNN